MEPVSAAVLGCGVISDAYLEADDRFDEYEIVACADIDEERTREQADEYGVTPYDPDELAADDDVELVINLTPPSVHAQTCEQFLTAGKHVYVEKPLAVGTDDADAILETAAERGLAVGSAPDTFLGAGLQTCRSAVDEGRIGDPVGATAVWLSAGHEFWHPNPDLFYRAGGGPLFDMGPYYVTALVSLFGPATRVSGSTARTHEERTIRSEPRHGETLDVEVPTHESGVVDFANGATATVVMSYDAPGRSTLPEPVFEVFGTRGTMKLPDPNHFDGPVGVREAGADGVEDIPLTHDYTDGRGIGVADLAKAVRSDWAHRTSAGLARHVLEILEGVRESSETGEHVAIESTVERPEPLPSAFPEN